MQPCLLRQLCLHVEKVYLGMGAMLGTMRTPQQGPLLARYPQPTAEEP